MTNNGRQDKNSPGRLHLRTDTLDSWTPLRCPQNDSAGLLSHQWIVGSGSMVKYLPLSARRGRDTERGFPQLLEILPKRRRAVHGSTSSPRTLAATYRTNSARNVRFHSHKNLCALSALCGESSPLEHLPNLKRKISSHYHERITGARYSSEAWPFEAPRICFA